MEDYKWPSLDAYIEFVHIKSLKGLQQGTLNSLNINER